MKPKKLCIYQLKTDYNYYICHIATYKYKLMKKIIGLFLMMFFLFGFSQTNNTHNSFTGYWFWKDQNKTFKVHIYSEYNMLKGDYWLTETINGQEITIYKSDKLVDVFFDINFGNAIAGYSKDGKTFNGIIKDNVLLGDGIHGVKEGELNFVLLGSKRAKWKIKYIKTFDKKRKIEPENFSIPTNIVLIKARDL